ncbi:MAG: SprB repeat-containing protein, partial [Saprospiraceae bacterium]
MQALVRIILLTWYCIVIFSNICSAQVEMKVALAADEKTYEIVILPEVDWGPPQSTLISAQVTLTFPNGNFSITNTQYNYGLWTPTPISVGPTENPNQSYVSFTLQTPVNNLPINNGEEVVLFTFENGGDCVGAVELINHDTDPFMPPNSRTLNVGNYLGLFGGGPGSNSYQGNYETGGANCGGENEGGGEGGGDECSITLDEITSTAPTRCGAADGTITIQASTTSIPIQYTINGGDSWENDPDNDGTYTYEGLVAGTEFDIAIRDAAAICEIESDPLTLDAPLAAAISGIDNTPASACSAMDGSIQINATTENNAELEYSIDDALTFQSSSLFENLGTGQYKLWIRNATNNCDTPYSTITVDCEEEEEGGGEGGGDECNITLDEITSTAPTRCGAADGTITIEASTTGIAIQYTINGGDSWENDPDSDGTYTYEGLVAGTEFDIAIRDAAAICEIEGGNLTLDAPLAAAISGIDNTPASACDATDGSIQINATTENNAELEYSIDDGLTFQSSSLFENLGTGEYKLWIRNATNNCDTPYSTVTVTCDEDGGGEGGGENENCDIRFELEQLTDGSFQLNMLPDVTYQFPLNIVSTAQVTIKVSTGKFQMGPIQNLIDGASFTLNATYAAPSEAPDYDYIAIGLGSIGTMAIPFMANEKVALFRFTNEMTDTNGEITLMDNANDEFFPPNSQNANVSNQITVAGSGDSDTPLCLQAEAVTFGEEDDGGGEGGEGDALTVEVMQIDVNCHGQNNGSATASPAGGAQGYRYEWSTGATTVSVDQLAAGTYEVTVIDANENEVTTSITITEPEPIELGFSTQMPDCQENNGSIALTIDDPSPSGEGYAIQWTPDVSTTEQAENLAVGTYDVSVWDANGCETQLNNIILTNPDCPVDELPYPIAFTDTIRIDPGEEFEVSVLLNDSLFSALRSLYSANAPEVGNLTQTTDTTLLYQSDAQYCGQDQFAYIVC